MRFEPAVKWAFLIACSAMLLGAIGFRAALTALNVYIQKEATPLRGALDTIPTTLGKWRAVGADERLSEEIIENLGTRLSLNRVYAINGNPGKGLLQVHVAFYTGTIDTIPHIPERCFTAAGLIQLPGTEVMKLPVDSKGWKVDAGPVNRATGLHYTVAQAVDPVTRIPEEVNIPVGDIEMTVSEFQRPRGGENLLLAGYLFIANGRLTPSALGVKSLSFNLSDRYAYYCKVQFTGEYHGDATARERYVADSADLLRELLPYLMQRLPNWPDYEAQSAGSAPTPRN